LAKWKTQYELNIQSAYGNPQGAGWYNAGTTVPVNIQALLNYPNSTRRVFMGWSGDYTGQSTNITVQMNSPEAITANWATQYLVTFKIVGLENSTTLELKVNNTSYPILSNGNVQAWYSAGSTINPTINQTVTYAYIFVYNFAGWHDSAGAGVQMPIIVNGPESYSAQYNLAALQLDYQSNYLSSAFDPHSASIQQHLYVILGTYVGEYNGRLWPGFNSGLSLIRKRFSVIQTQVL